MPIPLPGMQHHYLPPPSHSAALCGFLMGLTIRSVSVQCILLHCRFPSTRRHGGLCDHSFPFTPFPFPRHSLGRELPMAPTSRLALPDTFAVTSWKRGRCKVPLAKSFMPSATALLEVSTADVMALTDAGRPNAFSLTNLSKPQFQNPPLTWL